jgi:hypothetical protein
MDSQGGIEGIEASKTSSVQRRGHNRFFWIFGNDEERTHESFQLFLIEKKPNCDLLRTPEELL